LEGAELPVDNRCLKFALKECQYVIALTSEIKDLTIHIMLVALAIRLLLLVRFPTARVSM
jgi:hypothetical protein